MAEFDRFYIEFDRFHIERVSGIELVVVEVEAGTTRPSRTEIGGYFET